MFKNLIIFGILLISSYQFTYGVDEEIKNNSQTDVNSISVLIESSTDDSLDKIIRHKNLNKAYELTQNISTDSLINHFYHKIATKAFIINDSALFRKANNKSIYWAKRLHDSTKLAYDYWDLGDFYDLKGQKDSAYYAYGEAKKIYEAKGNRFHQGRMLLNMAIIQSDIKDYTGSEVTSIEAIKLLEPLEKYFQLYSVYNNLGIVLNELEDYSAALRYHQKALDYQKKISGGHTYKENSFNNIGIVYKNLGEHKTAITYYNRALKNKDLKKENPKLYAMLLDNLAYSKFKLKDTSHLERLFEKSLHIRDSISDTSGYTVNLLHLAELYAYKKDTVKALEYAEKAKDIAIENANNRDLLSALWYLSQIDKERGYQYSQRHIILSDSLLKQERIIRNKFTRIRFETDQFIEENIDLSEQNKWLGYGAGFILVLGIVFWFIRKQRLDKLMLKMAVKQKQLNDEIYNTMLKQQDAINSAKNDEKEKISRELHDGVLSDLHGTRVTLSKISEQQGTFPTNTLTPHIKNLKKLETDIRKVSHSLHEQALLHLDFNQVLSGLIEKNQDIHGYKLVFIKDNEVNWDKVSNLIKMNIYRILQENLNNINKYAQANNVKIQLTDGEDSVSIMITDDGIGFNPNKAGKGIGLKNMRARVKELDGSIQIISSKGNGTKVKIDIPLFIKENNS